MVVVEHHTKYKEIHGYDEVVWMEKGEYYKLHQRLRREGKCNILVDVLQRISSAAYKRTIKSKEYMIEQRVKKQGQVYDWREL